MRKVIVSRTPTFIGHDGSLYNAVYGELKTLTDVYMTVGKTHPTTFFLDREMVCVDCTQFPKVASKFFPDGKCVSVYNADE